MVERSGMQPPPPLSASLSFARMRGIKARPAAIGRSLLLSLSLAQACVCVCVQSVCAGWEMKEERKGEFGCCAIFLDRAREQEIMAAARVEEGKIRE